MDSNSESPQSLGERATGSEPSNLSNLGKLLDLLTAQERIRAVLLLGMVLIMGGLEMIGVASVMPFIALLSDPSTIETNRYLSALYRWIGFDSTSKFLGLLGALVFFLLLIANAFKALTMWMQWRFTYSLNHALSCRLFRGFVERPYSWFLGRHSADLSKAMLSEASQVVNRMVLPSLQICSHGFLALVLIALLIIVDPVIALLMSAVLGGAYALIYLVTRSVQLRLGKERLSANRARFQITQEAFSGIKELKVLGKEEAFLQRFVQPSSRFASRESISQTMSQLPRYALEVFGIGGILLITLYLFSTRGNLGQTLPLIALYVVAGYRLLPALQQVYQNLSSLRYGGPALASLYADLVEGMAEREPIGPAPFERLSLRNALELRQVTFAYPGTSRPALDGMSLSIPANTCIGLVGPTGSGKTTLVDLILCLLSPSDGELLVDGEPLAPGSIQRWQRNLGYVPQQIFLADDTVAANIALGVASEDLDMAAVERAARIANLHQFVSSELEHGYETRVGQAGVRLSGGQRQRIGIARALYHDPGVLIFDEATSALDNLTERAVMDAVQSLGRSKTIILIAHRLSTVRDCERIFLLERGRIVGEGSYDELIRGNERFRSMAAGRL